MKKQSHITMITGGARSGKSALAETMMRNHAGTRIYIATAQPWDDEMAARIALHQQRRDGWRTIEEPRDLVGALDATDGQGPRLIDCLTLWLSNCDGAADIDALTDALTRQASPVVLVTNELGQGIVPVNALARRFRDDHGRMNQAVAAVADQVWMAVSGLPLRLKPAQWTPDD
ncbi:bifunctional adenosylcobinamide kinase/adenosylcobinamide-phosphate guanylyltransferase [Paracoccus sp. (in: a-proteobacteria)]|uniref:bifunctional adenosylcobinamide kinase/adenosylcobinamide-phosphate guanylyltransferase n=1 Tax=Paracoccus sp. TaxID=267 RepID=UPI0026DF7AAD|nr:bifunctional adenosylcobinamide kinase/adenosylcobinamide-phosphate guanylyltransferase [Paracoccus sp. (in: a-proteobacteria)]MDO5646362.1 bifunctional adenosylcobinamide kinase/adenosylcobinamide-phosphate guanylyltransferase [Paracoccus sp. (in: a-proteobacteria)]